MAVRIASSPVGLNGASFGPMHSLLSSITSSHQHLPSECVALSPSRFCPAGVPGEPLPSFFRAISVPPVARLRHIAPRCMFSYGRTAAGASGHPNTSLCDSPSTGDLCVCDVHMLGNPVFFEGVRFESRIPTAIYFFLWCTDCPM